ncbi:uncharacterized protein LOC119188291 [Rhipicephalus microplus]|uniref:uncharacterized protein LOC119188291 n=1 Tax=Rhipicephalus microplus TaxID=6941 RepID=UPI003F6A9221
MVLTSDLRCADKKCNQPLPNKNSTFLRCSMCCKLTCRECNAQHEGKNCKDYRATLAEQDQAGCPEAITWEQIAGSSSAGHVSDDTVVPEEFIPGQHYVCGVDGCCFAVVLHEGSKKFWCALCHSRHKIVDNKIIRAKGPPISVTMYNQVLSARALWKK